MNPAHPDYPFPPGQHPARQPKRTRKPARAPSNVVPIRKPVETTEDIVASVESRRMHQERSILQLLEDANAALNRRHAENAANLLPIGLSMDAGTLADWTEIGMRMAGKGRRS